MPQRLKHRQEKIQNKRKKTPWREFVMEIASWYPVNLYKNKGLISKYPETHRSPVIAKKGDYSVIYNGENNVVGFYDNFGRLRSSLEFPGVIQQGANENSDYVEMAFGLKNGYLSFTSGINSENVMYSCMVYDNCSNVIDSYSIINDCQNIYSCKSVLSSSSVFRSVCIKNSYDIRYSSNLIGCKHCIGCENLINKSYCIENKEFTKDEYYVLEKKHKSYRLRKDCIEDIRYFDFGNENVLDSTNITNAIDICNGYDVSFLARGRNIVSVHGMSGASDIYDCFDGGSRGSSDFYGVLNSGGSSHLYCSLVIETSSNLYYCYDLENSSYCLGCIGLRNKSYCIFNKQYTKEERYDKVDEIFAQMEKDGDLGKFFPGSMNPFYFNDTAAALIEDFTKEEVTAAGYLRRDEEIKVDIPERMEVVEVSELGRYEGRMVDGKLSPNPSLGEGSRYIDPSILKKVIRDETGNIYRVIKMEYDFLVKHGLPLPRKHWLERLKGHFRTK